MVEDKETYKKTKTTRPKAVYYWTVLDVIRWYNRHLGLEYPHAAKFEQHHITGRALLRLNESSLKRMGIPDEDRDAILKEILKQRLKTDIMEIKDLENLNNVYENCFQETK